SSILILFLVWTLRPKKEERRSLTFRRFNPCASAATDDMFSYKRKADSRPFDLVSRFKCLESLPDSLVKFRRDAGTIVTDNKLIQVVFFADVDPDIRVRPPRVSNRI